MPYNKLPDLPKGVEHNLPKHAQEIYQAAYNDAYHYYKDPKNRDHGIEDSLEEVAHKVAWSAVKQKYVKNKKGEWIAR